MSLIRQVWLLMIFTVVLAFAGSLTVSTRAARDYLETQLSFKNNDTAQLLALTLAQAKGDTVLMELALSAQFDTGFYEALRIRDARGQVLVERVADAQLLRRSAPAWFSEAIDIRPDAGRAQLSDGWRALGEVEVVSHTGFAHDELWRSAWQSAGWLGLLGLIAGLVAAWGVRNIRRPLDATVDQAQAIVDRRFITVPEPGVPELRRVSRAMNRTVEQLRGIFHDQARQVEQLRREANVDTVTGLDLRRHFLGRFGALLEREDGADAGGLLLVRLQGLAEMNQRAGRAATDAWLARVAQVLQGTGSADEDWLTGRLNGSDLAVVWSAVASDDALVDSLVDRLVPVLGAAPVPVRACLALIGWRHGQAVGSLLAQADEAMAEAEAQPAAAEARPVLVRQRDAVPSHPVGAQAWREGILRALADGGARLGGFPVLGRDGQALHEECPLRLRLDEGLQALSARDWLPMARRLHLLDQVDLTALRLVLEAIAADGRPRGVNLSPVSLLVPGFIAQVRQLVAAAGREVSRGLWIEVAEAGAVQHFEHLRELGLQVRPLGVRLGLEHVGEHLGELPRVLEAGLDYVKLDATMTQGLAADAPRAQFVAGTVLMLRGMGLMVIAEGVADAADLAALWAVEIDGATGPAVRLA